LAGDTLEIENGSSLTINGNYRLINEGTIDNFGTFTVLTGGYVKNFAWFNNDNAFSNAGEVTNELGGTIDGKGVANSSVFINFGTINHSGTAINSGEIYNGGYRGDEELTATYNLQATGVVTNNGTLTNWATFKLLNFDAQIQNNNIAVNEFGGKFEATNGGAIYNNGTSVFDGNGDFNLINGAISVKSGSTFSIGGKLTIAGSSVLNIDSGGVFDNFGEIESVVGGRIQNGGTLNNKRFGVINTEGTILSDSGGSINNEEGAVFNNNNNGDIDNSAIFNNAGTLNNRYGEFDNNLTLNNTGSIINIGFQGAPLDGNIRNNGTIINEASGTIENNDSIFNYGVLTNNGTLTNNYMFDNYASGSINISGTLTNTMTLTAWCGGTITGPISGIPATSNCVVTGPVVLSGQASCATVGGFWDGSNKACAVGILTTDADVTVNNGVNLNVSTLLEVTGTGRLRIDSGKIESAADSVINLDGASVGSCETDRSDKMVIAAAGTLDNRGELNICRCHTGGFSYPSCKIDNKGTIESNGVINNDGVIWNYGSFTNNGELIMSEVAGVEPFEETGRAVLINYEFSGRFVNNGHVESHGLLINDETTMINNGTIDNYSLMSNGYFGCGTLDFAQDYTCFFENYGTVNNYYRLSINIKASFVNEAGSTLTNKTGSILWNNGYLGVREDATIFTETGSFFENLGDAIVEVGKDARVWVEGAVESAGTWLSGAQSTVLNWFGLSFHNYGTYINSGLLDNGGETGGFFENLATFHNSGTITNSIGRFANGADPNAPASLGNDQPAGNATANGILINTGAITVDSGTLDNYGEIQSFNGSSLTGTVSGQQPEVIDNTPPVASPNANNVVIDGKIDIPLLATDVDGDPLTYRVMGAGSIHGKVEIVGSLAIYTPHHSFDGEDQFFFVANDGQVDSNLGAITIMGPIVVETGVFKDGFETQP
jgi:hypothetical protein